MQTSTPAHPRRLASCLPTNRTTIGSPPHCSSVFAAKCPPLLRCWRRRDFHRAELKSVTRQPHLSRSGRRNETLLLSASQIENSIFQPADLQRLLQKNRCLATPSTPSTRMIH